MAKAALSFCPRSLLDFGLRPMTPTRALSGKDPQQTPGQIAQSIEEFIAAHERAVVAEEGRVLFDLRRAKYSLTSDEGRCLLQLWDEERNIVRRISAASTRGAGSSAALRLTVHRFGQTRPGSLDILADRDRRTPSTREAVRLRYLRTLERAALRANTSGDSEWEDWKLDGLRAAMDLEKSFGPAYARGSLVNGQQAWALIGVNAEETPATIDGVLTVGVLWLAHCRESAGGRRLYRGLRIVVPRGMAALTASRLAWMNPDAAQWELWELDERSEELTQRDAADHGNLATRLLHSPDAAAARKQFADATARLMAMVPEDARTSVELRPRGSAEMAFLLHGLEFARVRTGYAGHSFNRMQEITFGAGANETPLTEENVEELRALVELLCARRRVVSRQENERPGADPLYRMAPERWLESILLRDVTAIDAHLDPAHVYAQVAAFAANDRGMLDLLSVDRDGRLAVIELKADDDLHLVLQGLDYWVRVRWHHMQTADSEAFGLGELQRYGYFPGVRLSSAAPKLYLVAPALRIHPATEVVLRYLSPRVEWELVALNERWRESIKVVWRKRSSDTAR